MCPFQIQSCLRFCSLSGLRRDCKPSFRQNDAIAYSIHFICIYKTEQIYGFLAGAGPIRPQWMQFWNSIFVFAPPERTRTQQSYINKRFRLQFVCMRVESIYCKYQRIQQGDLTFNAYVSRIDRTFQSFNIK